MYNFLLIKLNNKICIVNFRLKNYPTMINSEIAENLFGANLRHMRKRDKITLEELSRLLDISKSSLSDYETNKTYPPLDVCRKLAGHFKVSLDAFDKLCLANGPASGKDVPNGNTGELREQVGDLKRELKLKDQQVGSLKTQLKLQKQLMESKSAEIQSLRIQIQLLEEQIKLLGGSR